MTEALLQKKKHAKQLPKADEKKSSTPQKEIDTKNAMRVGLLGSLLCKPFGVTPLALHDITADCSQMMESQNSKTESKEKERQLHSDAKELHGKEGISEGSTCFQDAQVNPNRMKMTPMTRLLGVTSTENMLHFRKN